jgi:Fe-S cluster assembly protein SufD
MTAVVGELPSLALVEKVAAAEPAWLAKRRRAAWSAFSELPMPSSAHDEDWRRTDLGKLDLTARPVAEPVVAIDLPAAATDSGVVVCGLAEAMANHPKVVERALQVAPGLTKLAALNAALWSAGVLVYASSGTALDEPVGVTFSAPAGGLCLPLVLVVLDDGARVSLATTYRAETGAVVDPVALVHVGAGAVLDYNTVQDQDLGSLHFALHDAVLEHDARLTFFGAGLGATLQKAYWNCILAGRGAEATLTGVVAANGSQHLDHQTLQSHNTPDTTSRLNLKVAVWDSAQSVYSGLINVEKEAVRADGYVQNRNLILSDKARAHSVPRLEIKANDVKCGHGATAGHVDEEQRFYLESRGVSRSEAESMIVRGFFGDALAAVASEPVREEMAALLERKIAAGSQPADV